MAAKLSVDMSVIFLLGDKLYKQNKALVFLRECIQNSLDAHSTKIDVKVECHDDTVFIIVTDNGEGIQDFEKYFLTIGGSSKRDTLGSIGGFGIAKLAIMAMDDWSIQSQNGMVSRDILLANSDIDQSLAIPNGCIVTGKTKQAWNIESRLLEYLTLINAENVCIIFNGEIIKSIQTITMQLGNNLTVEKIDTLNKFTFSNNFIIRLNGLPMFYDSVYFGDNNPNDNYLFDVWSDLTPYDDNYPFNANRESLTDSPVADEYRLTREKIQSLVKENAELQKQTKSNLRIEDGHALGGTFTKKDLKKYSWFFYTFSRYINQILDLVSSESYHRFTIGLSNDDSFQACYFPENKSFLLNPVGLNHDKSLLLSLAMHEVTHTFIQAHYEEFSTKHTEIITRVLSGIADRTFRW